MPFAISPLVARQPHQPWVPVPRASVELADQTATSAILDLGLSGLRHVRALVLLKALGGTNPTATFQLSVDDVAAFSSPEVIAISPTYAGVGTVLLLGFSNDGCRYVRLTLTLGGTGPTATYDAVIQAV